MKLLFVGHGRSELSAAANIARQLPRARFKPGFLAAPDTVDFLRDLGMPTLPLDGVDLDRVVHSFQPDYLVAVDPESAVLRERYDIPLACLDRYGVGVPDCDLMIRCCPLHPPAPNEPGVAVVGLTGGGLRGGGGVPRDEADGEQAGAPLVFLTGSVDETVHDHLAALDRPLRIVHVGPRAWTHPIAGHIEYRPFGKLPHPLYHDRLTAASLYVTTDATSMTLAEAVLAGVPALVLREDEPPVLRDNPYAGCFYRAGATAVRQALTELLDDPPSRAALRERQLAYRESLRALAPPAEAFASLAGRR